MKTKLSPRDILAESVRRGRELAERTSVARARQLLKRSQEEIERRLRLRLGSGADPGSFDVVRMRAALVQTRHVTETLKTGLRSVVEGSAKEAAPPAARAALAYLRTAQRRHAGALNPLPLDDAAVTDAATRGARASVLRRVLSDPDHPGQPGVLDRYGESTVRHFERTFAVAVASGASVDDVTERVTEASPFLQQAPAYWAERLVRTETMAASNAASLHAIAGMGPGMLKILSSVLDTRTGSDSIDVHGQIRRPSEPFDTWYGAVMQPPDRPNDRAVVVPHHEDWPLPPELRPYPRSLVVARWREEGRKGSPPRRPLVSTVKMQR